ncbi:MAG: SPFH domain-containing protein [Clostridiales bacterium]|nr:SPFH domain-containing protein [Clostridiales bacterium]
MEPICDILKYEGDNETFVWKHPKEGFNCLTQLIVHESQEAVFFMNGQALDLFGPGRYTLETQNIPIIGKLLNRATGDESPFHCEVYFINKTVQMAVKWGTPERIRYIDPDFGIPVELGASGDMNLMVSDSRRLLLRIVGTTSGVAWGEKGEAFTQSLKNCFRPLIATAVKSNLSKAIKAGEFNILEVDEHLDELSAILKEKIVPGFEEYGITIPQFYLTTVVLPEEDPNFKRLRELHSVSLKQRVIKAAATIKTAEAQAEAEITAAQRQIELEKQTTQTEVAKREAERKVISAQAEAEAARQAGFAEAQVMQAQGITKKDYVQAEVQKAFAEGMGNMGANGGGGGGGSAMSEIIGLGVGIQAAGAMSGQIGNIFAGMNPQQPQQTEDGMTAFRAKLDKIAAMKEAGMLNDEEFAELKKQLIAEAMK